MGENAGKTVEEMKPCPMCDAPLEPIGGIAFAVNHKPNCWFSLNNREWEYNKDDGVRMIVQRYDLENWDRRDGK